MVGEMEKKRPAVIQPENMLIRYHTDITQMLHGPTQL